MAQEDIDALSNYIEDLRKEYGKNAVKMSFPELEDKGRLIPEEIKFLSPNIILVRGCYPGHHGFHEEHRIFPASRFFFTLHVDLNSNR